MPVPALIDIRDSQNVQVGTPANPAKRGEPVAIRPADANAFSNVTTALGQVWFIQGVTRVDVAPTAIVWSSHHIQLLQVPNLTGPAGGGPANWELHVLATELGAQEGAYPFVIDGVAVGQQCPSIVRVSNGVYGSQASPALRNAPLSIVALAGYFGDANANAGTVRLANSVFPQGFAAPNVVWTPQDVSFSIPPDLPITPAPSVWDVYLTATNAAAPCGPHRVVVEGGPLTAAPTVRVAAIPNLPGRDDPRGQPVTLFALGGFFGGPQATEGTVTLRRGPTSIIVATDDVVWTPVAVTFLVPDLPDTATLAEWEALLQPKGGAALGPYRLEVPVAEPLLVFVPPVVFSEELLEVVALGLAGTDDPAAPAPVLSLLAYDTKGNKLFGGNFPPPPRATRTILGATATAPTVTALRLSPQCGRNQLFLDIQLSIQIKQGGYEKETNRLPTKIFMPPPHIGRFVRNEDGTATIGLPAGAGPQTGTYRSNEWVGPRATGTVTLLRLEEGDDPAPLETAVDSLAAELPKAADALDPAASPFPPADVQQTLGALRAQGQLDILSWKEEEIRVALPAGTRSGLITVWRDDLPSLPVPFVDLKIPCDAAVVSRLVNDAFKLEQFPLPDAAIPVGTPIPIKLVENPAVVDGLSKLLQGPQAPVQVTFGLSIAKNGQTPPMSSALDAAGTDVGGGPVQLKLGNTLNLFLRPDFEPLTGARGSQEWTVTVTAKVTGVCEGFEVSVGAPVKVKQLNLPVPQVAMGFRGRYYEKDWYHATQSAIVFLHPDTPFFGGKRIDRGAGAPAINDAFTRFFGIINALMFDLSLVSRFVGLPGSPIPALGDLQNADPNVVTPLERALNTVRNSPLNELTFEGHQSAWDMGGAEGYDPWWFDDIFSIIMLGPPSSSTFSMFEHPNFKGRRLDLTIPAVPVVNPGDPVPSFPAGIICGGYYTLWSMFVDYQVIGNLTSNGENAFGDITSAVQWQ